VHEVNTTLQIKKLNMTAYHLQTDGLVEHFNRTLQTILAKYISKQQHNWDQLLPYTLSAYRTQPHEVTGESPFYMLYGHEPNLPMDITAGIPVDQPMTSISAYWNELVQQLQQAHSITQACQLAAQTTNQQHYNKRHSNTQYLTGDQVWVQSMHVT
jgi:hypothetical protein